MYCAWRHGAKLKVPLLQPVVQEQHDWHVDVLGNLNDILVLKLPVPDVGYMKLDTFFPE